MSKLIEVESKSAAIGLVSRFTLDPWVGMLSLGGLAHYLNQPKLAIGFLPCILVCLVWQAFSPSIVTKWKIKDE